MDLNRRQLLRAGGAGLAGVVGGAAFTSTGSAWRGLNVDAYCKGYELVKLEVEGGEFVLEDSELGERLGENTFKVYNDYFDLEVDPSYDEEGEVASFDFSTDSDEIDHLVVKGGPETVDYLENPLDAGSDGTEIVAPVNSNGKNKGKGQKRYAVSNVVFKRCTGIAVDVTGTWHGAKPADVIDLSTDDVRMGVTHGPFHRSDQYVFDNAAHTKHGNGTIQGDGNLHLYFPYEESFVDDPADVRDASNFKARVVVEGADGSTWAGEDDLPTIV